MEKPTKVASAIALTFLLFIGGLVAIPFLAVAAAGESPGCGAAGPVEVEDDGTPSLLGPPTLTVAGVAGTAPYLRDGSYPRIRDLDALSRELYRGFRRRAPSRGLTLEAFVESLVPLGLDGVEVWHQNHRPGAIRKLRKVARNFDLLETGGSDFHGDDRPDVKLGRGRANGLRIGRDVYEALAARAKSIRTDYPAVPR